MPNQFHHKSEQFLFFFLNQNVMVIRLVFERWSPRLVRAQAPLMHGLCIYLP